MSPVEIVERRKQGLCYYCDDKYSLGHTYKEPKFFQIGATYNSSFEEAPTLGGPEDEFEETQLDNDLTDTQDELVISLQALAGIFSPQTLKI